MLLVAASNLVWAVLLSVIVVSGASRKLPGSPQLGRATLSSLAIGLALNAVLIIGSEYDDGISQSAERALILADGIAFITAGWLCGRYVMTVSSLAIDRRDISQTAAELTVATGHWIGILLMALSLASLPLLFLFVAKSP
jgi:hypothetical protein